MPKIKVCGITNLIDASWAVTLGADYLGFNFYKRSPRKISITQAVEIISKLPATYDPVGVFVDEDIEHILKVIEKCKLKLVQLHGKESPEYCYALNSQLSTARLSHSARAQAEGSPKSLNSKLIKAFRIKSEASIRYIARFKDVVDYFLLDTYISGVEGGTGETFNWEIAIKAKQYNKPMFLAGGLTPENVKDAIERVLPFAVDVASGVERLPRRKDYDKLKNFIVNVKSVK